MKTNPFHTIPPEIWEKIIESLGRNELASLALTSRKTYPLCNPLLYNTAEISFCKCSDRYLNALAHTLSTNKPLAAIVQTFFVDMSVTCRLKQFSTSLEDLHSAKWHDRLKRRLPPVGGMFPGGSGSREVASAVRKDVNWHHDSMEVLQQQAVKQILRSMWNLENIIIILGRYYHENDILKTLLIELDPQVLNRVKTLKLRDLTTAHNPQMQYFTSLRSLDLGYVTVANRELCELLAANADTLEEVHLSWIVEASQLHLLATGSNGTRGAGRVVPLPHLKSFRSKGPHCFYIDGLELLLSETKSLETLHVDSLSHAAALVWANMMNYITGHETNARPYSELKSVTFGAPINSNNFWDAAAKLVSSCGTQLESISMNGSPKGAKTPFPQAFKECFAGGMPVQLNMKKINIVWRDEIGVCEETIQSIRSVAPHVELFHVLMEYPLLDSVNRLVDLFRPLESLRQLHLIFPLHDDNAPAHVLVSDARLKLDLDLSKKSCGEFVATIAGLLPSLEYLSWSIYEYFRPGDQPSYFVRIRRSDNGSVEPEDLGRKYREHSNEMKAFHKASIGSKRVLFSQKPSWRENMVTRILRRGENSNEREW